MYDSCQYYPSMLANLDSIASLTTSMKNNKNTGMNALERDFFCGDFPSRIDDLHICATIRK